MVERVCAVGLCRSRRTNRQNKKFKLRSCSENYRIITVTHDFVHSYDSIIFFLLLPITITITITTIIIIEIIIVTVAIARC